MSSKEKLARKATKETDDLTELLDELKIDGSASLKAESGLPKPNPRFQRELEATPFKIFNCIADVGYFSWTPKGDYRPLSSVLSGQEIRDQIDLQGKPDKLVSSSSIDLPKRFATTLHPQEYKNSYPYGQTDIAFLHVAFKERGVSHESIDFVFGGSTLEMLASQDLSSDYVVTKVPGTNVRLVVKNKEYIMDCTGAGLQFKRLMIGKHFNGRHDEKSVEHLHLMKIGKYNVLFRAEVDALYMDEPTKIRARNPRYYGTSIMFQMISTGSPTLCQGNKSRGGATLDSAHLESLHHVTRKALYSGDGVRTLETKILQGMDAIKEQTTGCKSDVVFDVRFKNGKLLLSKGPDAHDTVLFPPENVVKELLF